MTQVLRLLTLITVLALNPAPSSAQESVRYCDYPVYPPTSWSDASGKVRGMAPRAARHVVESLGLSMKTVVLGNWKRCLTDAAEGRVDLVIAYRSPERERSLLFSDVPLVQEEVAVFYNRNNPLKVSRLEDLAHYRGGLLFGESYGQDFDRFVAARGNVERVANNQQNFGKLIRGRIDYIAHELRTGKLYVEYLPGADTIAILPMHLATDYLYFAVSKKSPLAARMAEIDQQLLELTRAKLPEQWLLESEQAYKSAQRKRIP